MRFRFLSPAVILLHNCHNSSRRQQRRRRHLHLSPAKSITCSCTRRAASRSTLARGLRLNHPEAVALISMQMMESIRDGTHGVADLMALGQTLLGTRNVQAGMPAVLLPLQIEVTFPDGTKLLTVHAPVASECGNLEAALRDRFCPCRTMMCL